MNNVFFDTCVYHQPGIDLLAEVIDTKNILFGSEMVGAVRGIDPQTGHYFDDTKRYVDALPISDDAAPRDLRGQCPPRVPAARRQTEGERPVTGQRATRKSASTSTHYLAELDDIPGTRVFTATRARQGYHLNQFAMSLMKAENRERFKADERAYLDEWQLTEDAEGRRCWRATTTRCSTRAATSISSPKLFSTDGKSFQFAAGSMTGMTQEEYAADDDRGRPLARGPALDQGQ